MQKLHLVGFTPELDGLILSSRKGARSGSFVVPVDAGLLQLLADTNKPSEPPARTNGARHAPAPRQSRPESQLGPREMQELLRVGWSLEEVAVEARVDVDWVSRFAAPVMAEMRLVLDQALECTFDKPRVGPSALALAPSVRRNVADRGVRFTDEDFETGWRTHQLDDVLWVVTFEYQSRGNKKQTAEWVLDLETGALTSRNRLGTQLGHVQSTRRRISTAPPPKPKPKAAAARAVAKPPPVVATPGRRVAAAPPPPRASRATKAPTPTARARARKPAAIAVPAPAAPAPPAPRPMTKPDPWREELRRREAEQAAHSPPPVAATVSSFPRSQLSRPELASVRHADHEQHAVAIIGPTVRTLRRRAPEPSPPPMPPPSPTASPTASPADEWPDLEWSPDAGRPSSFKGVSVAAPLARRRRSEPLRGR